MICSWGDIGKLVITRRLNADSEASRELYTDIQEAVQRYFNGDWGSLCDEDKEMNECAVKNKDDRILARYKTCKGDIYIITEWDRSYTTILYCNEY